MSDAAPLKCDLYMERKREVSRGGNARLDDLSEHLVELKRRESAIVSGSN
jgi:hypothetical protein